MPKFVVTQFFYDLNDNNFVYHVGDEFPRHGYTPPPERIAELSDTNNRRGIAVIKKVTTKKKKVAESDSN